MPCSAELVGTEGTLQPKPPPTKEQLLVFLILYVGVFKLMFQKLEIQQIPNPRENNRREEGDMTKHKEENRS